MIRLQLVDGRDAARIVDALLMAANQEHDTRPMLARRYCLLADQLGDAIDATGLPACNREPDPLNPATTREGRP